MKRIAVICFLAVLAGCQGTRSSSTSSTAAHEERTAARTYEPLENTRVYQRVTTQGNLKFIVTVPHEASAGRPVLIKTQLVNDGREPVLLTYSKELRAVWPSVWANPKSKMPFTAQGQHELGVEDEFSNSSHTIGPGQIWEFEFDLARYFQLGMPEWPYLVSLSCSPETTNCKTGLRSVTHFAVGGLLIQMHSAGTIAQEDGVAIPAPVIK
jgi:hypothetical protein